MTQDNTATVTADVCAVIVTYNRSDKLKQALRSYSQQLLPAKYIIVVDNASTDDTALFLKQWETVQEPFQKFVITSGTNLGGSGGFFLGQKKAAELDANWIMLADDDAYPAPDYLQGLQSYIERHNPDELSIVCGKVMERGTCVNVHRTYLKSKWKRKFQEYIPEHYYGKDYFEPDFVSYVGILINKKKLTQAGFVNKDYFIWYDDTEHSYRLKKLGKIVCLPAFSMLHDVNEEDKGKLTWKHFYGFRNNIDFFKKHFPLQCPFIVAELAAKTLLSPLHGRSGTEMRMRFVAIIDGLLGKLGKHSYYKPGWKP